MGSKWTRIIWKVLAIRRGALWARHMGQANSFENSFGIPYSEPVSERVFGTQNPENFGIGGRDRKFRLVVFIVATSRHRNGLQRRGSPVVYHNRPTESRR